MASALMILRFWISNWWIRLQSMSVRSETFRDSAILAKLLPSARRRMKVWTVCCECIGVNYYSIVIFEFDSDVARRAYARGLEEREVESKVELRAESPVAQRPSS